jgi:hypothetical protein
MGRGQQTKHAGTREPRASTETIAQTQFPFTSDQPEQGRIPADGDVHNKPVVEIATSSVAGSSCAPWNAADPEHIRFSSRRTSRASGFAVTSTIRIPWERLPCNANLETGD